MLVPLLAALPILVIAIVYGVIGVRAYRRRALKRKMLSYCRRDENGQIYVADPKTGTMHNLSELLTDRFGVSKPVSPRQAKRARMARRRERG